MNPSCFCLSVFAAFHLSATENNPLERVNKWIGEEKLGQQNPFHTFVTLATVNRINQPTTRLIELISLDNDGALFFTHRNSRKAQDLSQNSNASMNLWLPSSHRQVSLEGQVVATSREEAQKHWKRMPRNMQLTFLSSNHSEKIDSLDPLRKKKERLDQENQGKISLPDAFIGYRLVPDKIIFFEVHFGDFADKEVALREEDRWILQRFQP